MDDRQRPADSGWVNHLGMLPANMVDSVFNLSGVSETTTSFGWEGKGMIHTVRG